MKSNFQFQFNFDRCVSECIICVCVRWTTKMAHCCKICFSLEFSLSELVFFSLVEFPLCHAFYAVDGFNESLCFWSFGKSEIVPKRILCTQTYIHIFPMHPLVVSSYLFPLSCVCLVTVFKPDIFDSSCCKAPIKIHLAYCSYWWL